MSSTTTIYETQHQTDPIEPAAVGEAGQAEETMRDLSEIVKANGTTQADIDGSSFIVVDGARVSITPLQELELLDNGAQYIDSLECPESRTEERRAELRRALDELND